MNFFEWKVYEVPNDIIIAKDRFYLGNLNTYQAVLVVKNKELRMYTYEYDESEEEIDEERMFCGYMFENFYGQFKIDTMGYVKVDIDTSESPQEIAEQIANECKRQLTYFPSYFLEEMTSFLLKRIWDIEKSVKAFAYYK